MRVETDLKLNMSMDADGSGGEREHLINTEDSELVSQKEVHFIMLEGVAKRHEMGILGFFKMLWKSRKKEILPMDGRW